MLKSPQCLCAMKSPGFVTEEAECDPSSLTGSVLLLRNSSPRPCFSLLTLMYDLQVDESHPAADVFRAS